MNPNIVSTNRVIIRDDGAWIACATHNPSSEGGKGESVYTTISKDRGETWGPTKKVFDAGDEQYAYSTMMKGANGRLYILYVQNYQNITTYPNSTQKLPREDMMGGFFYRYSENGGETWSDEAFQIHIPQTKIDKQNQWNGSVQLMWLVDKGFQMGNDAFVAFTKIGLYAVEPPTSGWLLHSSNLRDETDPSKVEWEVLPSDDNGIRSYNDEDVNRGCGLNHVGHSACISSESHVISLNRSNTNELYVVFRTDAGFLGSARSLDGGHSFELPHPSISTQFSATHYSEPGSAAEQLVRPLKNPRGPITPIVLPDYVKEEDSADVLMLYYNNGHVAPASSPEVGVWTNRNPYWIIPGYIVEDEKGKTVEWGEPEIALYVPGAGLTKGRGPGYPDFVIERNDTTTSGLNFWITETQKQFARLHKVPDEFLYDLLHQRRVNQLPLGYTLNMNSTSTKPGTNVTMATSWPDLPLPDVKANSNGLAWTFWLSGISLSGVSNSSDAVLVDSKGLRVAIVNGTAMELHLNYGNISYSFATDSQCSAWLFGNSSENHFVAFSLDAGSRVITAFVDGVFCDGGPQSWDINPLNEADARAAQGWDMIPDELVALDESSSLLFSPSFQGTIHSARFYPRFLRTADLLGAWRWYSSCDGGS